MMIAARRKKAACAQSLRQLKAQHAVIERQCAVEVGHLQVHVANPGLADQLQSFSES